MKAEIENLDSLSTQFAVQHARFRWKFTTRMTKVVNRDVPGKRLITVNNHETCCVLPTNSVYLGTRHIHMHY